MEEKKQITIGSIMIDKTLFELLLGIIGWGVICQLAGVWFVSDKQSYSMGVWIGVVIAAGAAVHMWWGLDKALDASQDAAIKQMQKYNIIRYLVIVLAMGLVMVSGIANPLSTFLTIMGLKVAAYVQPFTHKICTKFYK